MDRRGRQKRLEALERCLEASKLFRELRSERYEGLAQPFGLPFKGPEAISHLFRMKRMMENQ